VGSQCWYLCVRARIVCDCMIVTGMITHARSAHARPHAHTHTWRDRQLCGHGMAPASLVSALGAITVISNAVLSKVMLNEPMPKGGHTCCSVGTPQRPVCMGVFVRLELKATQRPHYDQFVKYLPIKEACSEKKIPAQRIEHHQGQGHVCAESCESVSALASANEQGSHIGTGQVCQRSS